MISIRTLAVVGLGAILAFPAFSAPAEKKKPPFVARLEEAFGEYRLLKGKGHMCSEGPLAKIPGEPDGVYGLGANLVFRAIDEGEKTYAQDEGCETRETSTSKGNTLTIVTRYLCPGHPEKKTIGKLKIEANHLRYEDAFSLCVYEKSTSPRKAEDE